MPCPLQFSIKPSIFESEETLILDPSFIQYGAQHFSKFDIADIRYGIKPINGFRVRIGRVYSIDIRSMGGEILKIRMRSAYRVRRIHLGKKFKQIVEAIFDNYINDISKDYLQRFYNNIEFDLLGNTFKKEGVIFNKATEIIPWSDLGTKNYYSYYALFSKAEPNINRTFTYLLDWNTIVLFTVTRSILKSKEPI